MADVLALVKIYPEDVVEDFSDLVNKLRDKLPEGYNLNRYEVEEVAFGYKVLKAYITFPEETEGGTEHLESLILEIPGVDNVEVEGVTRI